VEKELWAGAFWGAVAGVLVTPIVILLLVALGVMKPKGKRCPNCGHPFPIIRRPGNQDQWLWGGATCSHCGCEVDRHGQKIRKPRNPFDDGTDFTTGNP
jgi:hypothetical protein